jgi:oxygen-independent coproporphyrinogen-3 oxidase
VQSRDWDAYELSNFAAPGARAVHNCGYWLHRPCAAFGLGAAGLERTAAGAVRYRRPRQFAEFLSQPDGRVDAEWLGPHEIVAERLLTGLRSFVGVPSEWLRIWDSVAPHGWAERLRSEGAWIEGLLGITLAPERRMMAEAVAARWAADLDPLARSGHLPMLD